MTNAEIIFAAEQELAEQGKIQYTGRTLEFEDSEGKKIIFKETEEIHTYNTWKELGYQVQKGQKAVAKFVIWKYSSKFDEVSQRDESKMFMKKSAFFSRSQVEAIA